jgi:sigma-E factor negative regulatory protein RseC
MSNDKNIEHEGIVREADEKSVTVLLSRLSACSGCHSEKSCGISGNTEKIVNIRGRFDLRPGDHVVVTMKQSLGYSALFIGYLMPLLIVLLFLIIFISLSVNELYAGIFSIGVLIPYYSGLFVYRKYIDKKFSFTIKS